MSVTFSELAKAALLESLTQPGFRGQRLVLGDLYGLAPGELFAAVPLPPLRSLVALHPDNVLREHEHRHEAEVRERARVHSARGGEGDVCAVEPEPLHEQADARAGRL